MAKKSSPKKHRIILLFTILAIMLSSVGVYYAFFTSPVSNQSPPSEIKLRIKVYDYLSGAPIEGLSVSLGIYTGVVQEGYNQFRAIISEVSVSADPTGGGQIIIDAPANITLSKAISIQYVSMPGIWILGKTVGERQTAIPEGRWYVNSTQLASNVTRCEFRPNVNLLQEYNGSTLYLDVNLYVTQGKTIGIYNPTSDMRRLDSRLSIYTLSTNFIEYSSSKAVVPVSEPLSANMSLSYGSGSLIVSSALGDFGIMVDTQNKTFVDFTPLFIRSLSSTQTGSLKELLETIEPYGFQLDDLYKMLSKISALYEQSAQNFEHQNKENATKSLVSAIYLYRDAYNRTSDTYSGAMGWTPTLIIILIFFSFALSRMTTEKRLQANLIFTVLLLCMFYLFISTQPNFRLYLDFVLSFFTQRIQIPFFSVILIQSIQTLGVVIVFLILLFTQLRDFTAQTFGVSIRNLRRRKVKTILALTTIVIVSASAMSLLTFTPETTNRFPLLNRTSKVDDALVIFKRVTRTIPGLSYSEWNEPLRAYEIDNFQSGNWTQSVNVYGISSVNIRRADGFVVDNFTRFNVVVVNPQFMDQYLKPSEVLGPSWRLNSTDQSMIMIGSEIASHYNLTEGMELFLNNGRFTVKSIFNERDYVQNLRDIDDDLFFTLPSSTSLIFDPQTMAIRGGSFIIGSTNDFALSSLSIYKVSIVASGEFAGKVWNIAEEFLPVALDYWMEGDAQLVRTYEIHLNSKGGVFLISGGMPTTVLSGNWEIHVIPLIITAMLLLTNALGTVSERKPEIRTLFTVGASPTRIRLIFILEGMTLGVVGGILGYVAGYGIAQFAGYALPSIVQSNLITGAPFTIAFFTAFATSLIGCLIPSGISIKTVVPSGTLTKKVDEIIDIKETGNEAYLEVPIKLQPVEIRPFDNFLRRLTKEYSYGMFRQLILRELTYTESANEKRWSLMVNCASDFQVSIILRPNEDLRIHIQPYSVKRKESERWGGRDFQNLRIMAPVLRKELMGYLSYKPKQVTRREIK